MVNLTLHLASLYSIAITDSTNPTYPEVYVTDLTREGVSLSNANALTFFQMLSKGAFMTVDSFYRVEVTVYILLNFF